MKKAWAVPWPKQVRWMHQFQVGLKWKSQHVPRGRDSHNDMVAFMVRAAAANSSPCLTWRQEYEGERPLGMVELPWQGCGQGDRILSSSSVSWMPPCCAAAIGTYSHSDLGSGPCMFEGPLWPQCEGQKKKLPQS